MFTDWLRQQALSSPENIGLIAENRAWDYRAIDRQVDLLAEHLAASGVSAGLHVAALLANCPETIFLVHALARLGAILVPLNLRHSPVELSWQVTQADCTFLIYHAQTRVAAVQIENAQLTRLNLAGWNLPQLSPARQTHLNHPAVSSSLQAQRSNPSLDSGLTPGAPDLDRLQAIVFTSGTTGKPKGAQLTFGNHFYSATASAFRLGIDPDDHWLATMPLFHVGGLAIIFRSCLYAITLVLQERFDAQSVLQTIVEQNISLVSLTPTMLHRLLEVPGSGDILARLRCILLGGAAAPARLLESARSTGLNIALTYGMTETASQIATAAPELTRRKPGSVGKPLLFCRVRILDDQGNLLPAGQIGLIAVAGPNVTPGYYLSQSNNLAQTAAADFITGDLGYLDQDGDLWVVQRREDLIITGGENVYPAEVEAALLALPGVANACVVGLDDPEWGQRVAAAIVPTSGVTLQETALITQLRSRLAGYKIPRRFMFIEQLPQTESGKILRQQVRARFSDQINTHLAPFDLKDD